MTRYTPLILLGETQAWLAERWWKTESTFARFAYFLLWVPLRATFLAGYWIAVPDDRRRSIQSTPD